MKINNIHLNQRSRFKTVGWTMLGIVQKKIILYYVEGSGRGLIWGSPIIQALYWTYWEKQKKNPPKVESFFGPGLEPITLRVRSWSTAYSSDMFGFTHVNRFTAAV